MELIEGTPNINEVKLHGNGPLDSMEQVLLLSSLTGTGRGPRPRDLGDLLPVARFPAADSVTRNRKGKTTQNPMGLSSLARKAQTILTRHCDELMFTCTPCPNNSDLIFDLQSEWHWQLSPGDSWPRGCSCLFYPRSHLQLRCSHARL